MSEIIRISNFGGIKEMEMELKPINVVIGPQASGKSVTVKLLYFFKSFFGEVFKSIENGDSKRELNNRQIEKFYSYFPKDAWPEKYFKIEYSINKSSFTVERKTGTRINFAYSDNLKKAIDKCIINHDEQKVIELNTNVSYYRNLVINRNKFRSFFEDVFRREATNTSTYDQVFVPAGRSFYANIQSSIFSILRDNSALDPFIIEFGSFYENYKRSIMTHVEESTKHKTSEFDLLISEILNGNYMREKEKDFLMHKDSRKVDLINASSGQQETLPMVLILKALKHFSSIEGGSTIYIEEPEAHIFPIAQKRIVQLLARTFNSRSNNFQIIITTHSPYILASFNNLMEAGKILGEKEGIEDNLSGIIPREEIISPDDVAAYSLVNGVKTDLIDPSTKLISQNILDSVSDELSIEFGKLLDLEF